MSTVVMQSLAYVQHSSSVPGAKLFISGDLRLQQRIPLPHRGLYNIYNVSRHLLPFSLPASSFSPLLYCPYPLVVINTEVEPTFSNIITSGGQLQSTFKCLAFTLRHFKDKCCLSFLCNAVISRYV